MKLPDSGPKHGRFWRDRVGWGYPGSMVSETPNTRRVPFTQPSITERERAEVHAVLDTLALAGDGAVGRDCERSFERILGAPRVLLTHACTGALEMSALLLDLAPGDEVIMPSYTFVSTANAFVLRGAVPVFVDIRADTLNLDPSCVAEAITDKTRAIAPVHYGGVGADMTEINRLARDQGLAVIEDAAQGVGASRDGAPLGTTGDLGCFSFHATKNIVAGEGGALIVNREDWVERAEIIREKGTDRSRFMRGQVDKYTWHDVGGSFLMSELSAACLKAQIARMKEINAARVARWETYHAAFEALEARGRLRRPFIPDGCVHNGHAYHLRFGSLARRVEVATALASRGISAPFHYVPLHSSPGGRRFGRTSGQLPVTEATSDGLLRLPLFAELTSDDQAYVIDAVLAVA